MSNEEKLNMPASMGGLMRYDEKSSSNLQLTPTHVMIFIGLIIAFVVGCKVFWPMA